MCNIYTCVAGDMFCCFTPSFISISWVCCALYLNSKISNEKGTELNQPPFCNGFSSQKSEANVLFDTLQEHGNLKACALHDVGPTVEREKKNMGSNYSNKINDPI